MPSLFHPCPALIIFLFFFLMATLGLPCGGWGLVAPGGILVPWPGIKPMSPTLEGRFLTVGPPGKSFWLSSYPQNPLEWHSSSRPSMRFPLKWLDFKRSQAKSAWDLSVSYRYLELTLRPFGVTLCQSTLHSVPQKADLSKLPWKALLASSFRLRLVGGHPIGAGRAASRREWL